MEMEVTWATEMHNASLGGVPIFMKISPKWKMDSAAELAVKNWYVQKTS